MMQKRMLKRILCLLTVSVFVHILCIPSTAAEKVIPSTKEYSVEIYNNGIFLGNEKEMNVSKGEAVFLTYTVESVKKDQVTQSGLIVTASLQSDYPYEEGFMQFNNLKSLLLKPGYTYFVRMEVTEFGFEYVVICSNEKEEGYITEFSHTVGELKNSMKYCGIWMAGEVSATLTHVRCYDKNGNDLGLSVKNGKIIDSSFKQNSNVNHSYEFTVKNKKELAISNAKYTEAEEIFFEYEVTNIKKNEVEQNGFIVTNNPTASYPYEGGGYMNFQNYYDNSNGVLTIPNVKYLIRFQKSTDKLEVTAKYTLDGSNTYITFVHEIGTYDMSNGYCSLWIAGKGLTSTFKNVKCYDNEGNNLGIQLNDSTIEVIHYGGLEDYSSCVGTYYCENINVLLTLRADQSMNIQTYGEDDTKTGTYVIDQKNLTTKIGKESLKYQYEYVQITDKEKNIYKRLKEYQIKFVNGNEVGTEMASMDNNYTIQKPEDPTMEGNTFLGWYLGSGEEHHFEEIVTQSKTLYAKWRDGDGNEYLATGVNSLEGKKDMSLPIVVGACALLAIITAAGCILIIKKGKVHEQE